MKEVLWAILKIFGFLLILPLIVASFIAFQNQILSLPVNKEVWVLWGAGSYIALNLFVYDFKSIYDFGKSLVEKIFTFFKPAGYVVPIFSVFLIILQSKKSKVKSRKSPFAISFVETTAIEKSYGS